MLVCGRIGKIAFLFVSFLWTLSSVPEQPLKKTKDKLLRNQSFLTLSSLSPQGNEDRKETAAKEVKVSDLKIKEKEIGS